MQNDVIPGPAGQKDVKILNLGTRIVNNYLISSEAGWILIDTGYAGGFPHFSKMLEKNCIRPGETPAARSLRRGSRRSGRRRRSARRGRRAAAPTPIAGRPCRAWPAAG